MIDVVQSLPKDLGPEAVGLSRELIKQCHVNESIEVILTYPFFLAKKLFKKIILDFLIRLAASSETELLLRIF